MAHLIHARLVESHDGGMGEPVENCSQRLLRVKLLRLEKLFQELFVEHGGDNVIHNCPEKREKCVQIAVESISYTIWLGGGGGYNILHYACIRKTCSFPPKANTAAVLSPIFFKRFLRPNGY